LSTAPNSTPAVSTAQRDALAAGVAGVVLLPGDPDYAAEAAPFNLAVSHRPAVIVGATGPADVQAAVRFAGTHRLPVAVLSTGHGPALAVEDAVLITTRRMTGVTIDSAGRTARVEAGVRWAQVVDEAATAGLAPLTGSSPTVGVIGYTLGGGLSVTMGRAFGWAADHVRRVDVVTADGELRHATPDSEADLFWALRGGKSNFGVVTALEFDLFPVTRLYAGGLFFAGSSAAPVLRAFQKFTAQAPDEVTSSLALLRMPDLPAVPEFMRGKLTVNVRFSYLGTQAEGEKLIAPLRAAAPTLQDTVAERPYPEFTAISPGPTEPAATVDHYALLDELSPATVDAILDVAGPGANSRVTVIDLRQLGGALDDRSGPANAVHNHGAKFVIFAISTVPPDQAQARKATGLALMERLRPWISRHKHPNFLSPSDATAQETRKAFDDPTYARLQAIKAEYDPDNIFRFNHNIPPRREPS
jgi:FAD/FMN-containing dehydrogenase